MMRAAALALFAVTLVLMTGCGSKRSTTEVPGSVNIAFLNMKFDLPAMPKEGFSPDKDGNIRWTVGDQNLQVLDGQLVLNGKHYGKVKAGDSIKLTPDGKLVVNGEQRQPDAGPSQ